MHYEEAQLPHYYFEEHEVPPHLSELKSTTKLEDLLKILEMLGVKGLGPTMQKFVTPEGIIVTINKKTGLLSFSSSRLSKLTPPSQGFVDYTRKSKRRRNPISYLLDALISWLTA